MKKRVFYSELTYPIGLVLIVMGVVLTGRANFGYSMVVAPAYLLHCWLEPISPFFTFGTAEYILQGLLLILLTILTRKFRVSYLLSFATAVIYGFILDAMLPLGAYLSDESFILRLVWFALGTAVCSLGVAVIFRTYFPPEAYELFVAELSRSKGWDIVKVKRAYDLSSCAVGLMMSFLIYGFGHFVGVNWGTIVCAAVNSVMIGLFVKLFDRTLEFKDALPWRRFFTGEERL